MEVTQDEIALVKEHTYNLARDGSIDVSVDALDTVSDSDWAGFTNSVLDGAYDLAADTVEDADTESEEFANCFYDMIDLAIEKYITTLRGNV
jgi:hypothetical protein